MAESRDIVALHSLPEWLPQTQTWLYTQIVELPQWVENHICCVGTTNLDQFGLPNIWCLQDQPVWRQYWQRGLRKLGLRRQVPFLSATARRCGADVLHSHFGPMGWRNVRVAPRLGLRHVVTFYGADVGYFPKANPRWRARYAELFRSADAVLCEGPHMARCLADLGCPEPKLRVHHLGVPVDEIAFRPRIWNGSGPLRVLLCGTFVEKKGFPYALAALARLKDQVELEITIIGDARPEPRSISEKEKILAAIAEHEFQPRVRMLGYQPHGVMFEEAFSHHVFLAPSVTSADGDIEGGAPLTLIELAATGMPVVSTRHCDIPEVVKHAETGLLATERDADELVAHLQWLTEHPQAWSRMARAARAHIERAFDARTQGTRLGAIYRELV